MNVFIPALKDANPFFDEIIFHSKHTFIFDTFQNYNPSYKVVLFHWPEQIFNWREPTNEELINLKETIDRWKLTSKLLYVVHNIERHYGATPNFKKLYQIIENNCDCMVHFGKYSHDLFLEKYPNKKHKIIHHPLYEKSFTIHSKEFARKKLNIDKNSLVIIAPGSIRNRFERKLCIKSFNNIKQKNKLLIIPRIQNLDFPYEFKGRTFLKKFIDVKKHYIAFKKWQFKKNNYYFNYNFINAEELSLMMSAADIVFIPRLNILNSGNVFLGLTFQKIIVGPNKGNVNEVLQKFNLFTFNPLNIKSVHEALNESIKMLDSYELDEQLLNEFKPSNVALQWDKLLTEYNS